jgi:transcriptional regulator GlxA family with amidase domain
MNERWKGRLLCVGLLGVGACAGPGGGDAPSSREPREAGAPLNVGFLIVDGVYNTELTAPYDMFHHTVFHTEPGMRVFTVAPSLDAVTTFEGLRVLPDHTFGDVPRIDVLVVPSAEHSMDSDLQDERMISWVREVGGRADYVLSLCDGAFVLAQAGLLDGRQATTFPSDIERMREMFPAVEVLDGVSFVHDGRAITSVGGAPSFEPALYLCERLYGERVARGIAKGLVIDWRLGSIEFVAVGEPAGD